MRRGILAIVAGLLCVSADRGPVDWAFWGGDPGGGHYSTLAEINIGNVGNLKQAWVWKPGETELKEYGTRPGSVENTPLVDAPTQPLAKGAIPDEERLADQSAAPGYHINPTGKLVVNPKPRWPGGDMRVPTMRTLCADLRAARGPVQEPPRPR
jgi:hypothetical protein